jgi:hypothetical protein
MIKSERLGLTGNLARIGQMRSGHTVLVGKPEVKRAVGKLSRKLEGNIKMDD